MLSKAYQKSSDLKSKFYSDLFYSKILRTLPWSLVFDTPIFQILAPCLNFEGAKNIYVLSPYLGLWRTLEVPDWVWHLDLDMDMDTSLWYTYAPNFCIVLILKVQRISMSFKSSFGALEGDEGSCLG